MTYLGVVLDQKLNWSLHIEKKVSKTKKILHLIKPAIHHIWGLDPKRMQWIYKQIILPRLTYGCLMWGHSLTNSQISKLETVERVALRYHASMWKTTPTASLQILLNKKPSHLEIIYVSFKTYIRCKHMFQNNHWDGIADNISANSHLKTIKSKCLTIRVILLKNNTMFLNYTFKIHGSSNVLEAILASTHQVCTILLEHATRGDTLLCSLGAGHTSVQNSIIRNIHVYNLVSTLNQIKNITGLYILMEGSKYDWLEYASNDTIYVDLFVTPKKDVINLTIQAYLADLWATKWDNIKGHAQTKFWCTGPDPMLAAKLLNMSREHLGWCIKFFTGHGWWKKHLKLANLVIIIFVIYANDQTESNLPLIYSLNALNCLP